MLWEGRISKSKSFHFLTIVSSDICKFYSRMKSKDGCWPGTRILSYFLIRSWWSLSSCDHPPDEFVVDTARGGGRGGGEGDTGPRLEAKEHDSKLVSVRDFQELLWCPLFRFNLRHIDSGLRLRQPPCVHLKQGIKRGGDRRSVKRFDRTNTQLSQLHCAPPLRSINDEWKISLLYRKIVIPR